MYTEFKDNNDQAGEQVAEEIRKNRNECLYAHCDISKPVEVKKIVEEASNRFGRLDIAYNNVGIEREMGFTADGVRTTLIVLSARTSKGCGPAWSMSFPKC